MYIIYVIYIFMSLPTCVYMFFVDTRMNIKLTKKSGNKIDASGVKRLIPCMSFCS